MEGCISTTELQDWFKITTKDYYSVTCHSAFLQEEECVKSVWLDILADFFAASVGGIEILISLTAIDHPLFYFRERSLTGGFFQHLYLSKYHCSCSKPPKLLSFCLSASFNKLKKICRWILQHCCKRNSALKTCPLPADILHTDPAGLQGKVLVAGGATGVASVRGC